jgi:hypothetical protein
MAQSLVEQHILRLFKKQLEIAKEVNYELFIKNKSIVKSNYLFAYWRPRRIKPYNSIVFKTQKTIIPR